MYPYLNTLDLSVKAFQRQTLYLSTNIRELQTLEIVTFEPPGVPGSYTLWLSEDVGIGSEGSKNHQ